MTTCDGYKLIGNLINRTTAFTTIGDYTKEIDIHEQEICPVKNFSAIFFTRWHWDTFTAQKICQKTNMTVAFVANQEDKENIIFYFKHIYGGRTGWIQGLLKRQEDDDVWRNMNTNETTILEWAENYPTDVDYTRMVVIKENETYDIVHESQKSNVWQPVLCTSWRIQDKVYRRRKLGMEREGLSEVCKTKVSSPSHKDSSKPPLPCPWNL